MKNDETKGFEALYRLKAALRLALINTPTDDSKLWYTLVKFLHFNPLSDISLWKYLFASETKSWAAEKSKNAVQKEKRSNSWISLLSDYLLLRQHHDT